MNPCNIHRYTLNGIEAVSVTLELFNIQIAVVYRSPIVSKTNLMTVVSRLLTHMSTCNMASVILGDFNEDILHDQNNVLLSLMLSFGFTQLVKSPTTSQDTLIYHVYYRNPSIQHSSSIMMIHTIVIMTQFIAVYHYKHKYCQLSL